MGVFYTNAMRFCYISQNNSHLSLGSAPLPCEEHFHESVLWFWVVKTYILASKSIDNSVQKHRYWHPTVYACFSRR